MIPQVDSTAAYTFKSKFETLNGVYRVRAETTFRDAVAAGVDFADNLYKPAGLSQTEYNSDYRSYANDKVAMLESVKDSSVVYYVPESIFLNVPDPTIKEYYPLSLVVSLGVFENTQVIYPLLDQIKDLVQAAIGVTDPLLLLTNPENRVYLTDADYTTLSAARDANTRTLVPLTVQIANLLEANAILAAKVAAYENRIAAQSN